MANIEKLPKQGDTLEEVLDTWSNGWYIKKQEDGVWYMNEYFTQEERNLHGDNLSHYLPDVGDIAMLKMFLIASGFDLNQKI